MLLNGFNPILTIEGSLLVLVNLLQMQLPLRAVSLKALFSLQSYSLHASPGVDF